MKFAYCDPPYLGCAKLYKEDPRAYIWDDPATHRTLFERLFDLYPDGWAVSCSSVSLQALLRMVPDNSVRIGAWVKPFASFKPGVGVAYTWEPVIFRGGRRIPRDQPTVRDFISCNIELKKGLTGAKPEAFCRWVISILNAHYGDELVDIFPGTGSMGRAWAVVNQPPPPKTSVFLPP
jgi:hypothetical protein